MNRFDFLDRNLGAFVFPPLAQAGCICFAFFYWLIVLKQLRILQFWPALYSGMENGLSS